MLNTLRWDMNDCTNKHVLWFIRVGAVNLTDQLKTGSCNTCNPQDNN